MAGQCLPAAPDEGPKRPKPDTKMVSALAKASFKARRKMEEAIDDEKEAWREARKDENRRARLMLRRLNSRRLDFVARDPQPAD
ncbi:hypothetical protein JAN5088_02545 [Jannaschia rubra]|uniref:Uncharacterized protein n=2 Tax=Jannaschia rubra TaxID=282197 RepID=A0A0M6XRK2_9RHOB|nr:hypothetical protein JAN5088_02545 [Jannaschia rubra]SFG08316.1 hypothetical protein SAMN04488517_102594 [Jannaschia rubra]